MIAEPDFDCPKAHNLCQDALEDTERERKKLQELLKLEQEHVVLLKSQRDEAYEELRSRPVHVPFYVWIVLGAAGSLVIANTVK